MAESKSLLTDPLLQDGAWKRNRQYPNRPDLLPSQRLEHGHYRVRFASHHLDLDRVLRLRFEVFNLELGEGLDASFERGRDEDAFDLSCHHLMVEDLDSGELVGTYRMQSHQMAREGIGFYSAGEFELASLPSSVLGDSVEVGRACIAQAYRNRHVLFLLWRGLALYMSHNDKRYLFGCCSLNSQDGRQGRRLHRQLVEDGRYHPSLRVEPLPGLALRPGPLATEAVEMPTLFATYMRYGALVCSEPAIDRAFKTIDFFVLLDIRSLNPRTYRLFFGP